MDKLKSWLPIFFIVIVAAVAILVGNTYEVKAQVTIPAKLSITSGSQNTSLGSTLTFQADIYSATRGEIFVHHLDNANFTCPAGLVTTSDGKKWCKVAEGRTSTFTGSFTFQEEGIYMVVMNVFLGPDGGYVSGDSSKQCSSNPYRKSDYSSCSPSDSASRRDIIVSNSPPVSRSIPAPVNLPTANLEGQSRKLLVGESLSFKANLSGGAGSGAALPGGLRPGR